MTVYFFFFLFILFALWLFISPKTRIINNCLWRINSSAKKVFLTFDDGPNGQWTRKILTILHEENVKATFFLLGKRVNRYPKIVKEIVDGGHAIGNHSFSHSYLLPFFSKNKIKREIIHTEEVIFKITHKKTSIFRPPHGFKTFWMAEAVRELGYKMICWDVMTNDYNLKKKANDITKCILRKVRPGSIIVFHDGVAEKDNADRSELLLALRMIIQELKKRDFVFRKLG